MNYIIDFLKNFNPVIQALFATCFTWFITALGAAVVIIVQPLLPYALGFAAGAMIFVVVEDVIPESQSNGNVDIATMGAMVGFALMMVLDVAFG